MTAEQLIPFCSKDIFRGPIQKPFSFESSTIATDGRILVKVDRVPDVPCDPSAPTEQGIETMFKGYFPANPAWHPLPPVPARPQKEPDEICSDCNGSGESKCSHCGHYGECVECGGEGRFPVDEKTQRVPVGTRIIDGNHLRLMEKLPGIKAASDDGKPTDPLCFIFEGGMGLVMPIRP